MTAAPGPALTRGRWRAATALIAALAVSGALLLAVRAQAGAIGALFDSGAAMLGLDRSARWHTGALMLIQGLFLALPGVLAYGAVMAAGPDRRLRVGRLAAMALGMAALAVAILLIALKLRMLGGAAMIVLLLVYLAYGLAMGDFVVGTRP